MVLQYSIILGAFLLIRSTLTSSTTVAVTASKTSDHVAVNLRVEHAIEPLTIDVYAPRFTWQLSHPERNQRQTSFRVTVSTAKNPENPIWDSGTIASNNTYLILVDLESDSKSHVLSSDTDYVWTVDWTDANGIPSQITASSFSTALLDSVTDWHGAEWISSSGNGSLNLYRTVLPTLDQPPLRARLYIAALGYYHTTINGVATDQHVLGPQSTNQMRVLYDVWDVTTLLQSRCNTLGVSVGHGWGSSSHNSQTMTWDRQFIALLSITASDGTTTYLPSTLHPQSSTATNFSSTHLQFTAGVGPVTFDDVYTGETFDGRIAQAIHGWDTCSPPTTTDRWSMAVAPTRSPANYSAIMSAHTMQTIVLRDYYATSGGLQHPKPGVFVFDFGQNMAGIITLRVRGCSVGQVIQLRFGEILWGKNRTVHNQFPGGDRVGGMARMLSNYTCTGVVGEDEVYRTQFSSFGFQFVQIENYPGVPMLNAITAHSLGPSFDLIGQFISSSSILNGIHHSIVASAAANWANDVPSDCPHRERRGYLGDGQHAMESVVSNFWAPVGYTKWLRDYRDQQQYINRTLGKQYDPSQPTKGFGHGRISGVAPFGDGQETDTAWAIATWNVPDFIAEWYDDDRFVTDMYNSTRWYMEHFIAIATTTNGWFEFDKYGDFGNMWTPADDYRLVKTQYFYIIALTKMASFARRVHNQVDVEHYQSLATTANETFMTRLYNPTTGCFGNCSYVSQIFGLQLMHPSANQTLAWANVLRGFGPNATNPAFANRFGGGIVTLKLIYPLFQRFGEQALALRTLLQTDRAPSLGYWVAQGGTTLHEAWNMEGAYDGTWVGSFNHIMLGSPGRWFYTMFLGIDRTPVQSQPHEPSNTTVVLPRPTWERLRIEPPRGPQFWQLLTSCSGAMETPIGQISVAWAITPNVSLDHPGSQREFSGATLYELEVEVPTNAVATIVIPTVINASMVTVVESGHVVWSKGVFEIGISGILAGVVGVDAVSVVLSVGSGAYTFTIRGESRVE